MQAAAHTPGGYGGVPQSVGKEFVGADSIPAAGMMLTTRDGEVLLMRRNDTGEWAFPGGHIEPDETTHDAAIRETGEETGHKLDGEFNLHSRRNKDGVDFSTFRAEVERFAPVLNHEHTAYMWSKLDALPAPLHPGVQVALDKLNATELDIARMIRDGDLVSPQRFKNMSLFAMRITGTGAAYRSKDEEFVWRSPALYLNDEFLARCNGLPVIFEHPEKRLLNSDEFADRSVGAIMLPYIAGDEVWGIAKIYDDEAIALMENNQLSTSPGVLVTGDAVDLDDGGKLLIEGKPILLDHLAICAQGVWDKGQAPRGVLSEALKSDGDNGMAEQEMKSDADKTEDMKADADPIRAIADSISALMNRMDAFEAKKADADCAKVDDDDDDAKKADADGDTEQMAADEDYADDKKADADETEKEKADATMKADADIARKIADLDRRIPRILSEAELNQIADTQSKADSVAAAFGESASRPVQGENPRAYRIRMAGAFKKHSADWKDVDLTKVDDAVLPLAEKAIYADAMAAANQPVSVPAGMLRERIRQDDTGRRIKEFDGAPHTWMRGFKSPRRGVERFSTEQKGA